LLYSAAAHESKKQITGKDLVYFDEKSGKILKSLKDAKSVNFLGTGKMAQKL